MTIQIPIHDINGQQTGTLDIDEQLLGGEVRPVLLKQAYVRSHANRRQGTAASKTRGQVHGSGKKMYRQKGTGNARRGNKKANLLRGGGHAKAKQYVEGRWRQDMPIKMRRLANRNALLAKAVDTEIKLIDNLASGFDQPSTKKFKALLGTLLPESPDSKKSATCLLAIADTRTHEGRSAKNIEGLRLTQIDRLNAFDILSTRYLVADRAAFEAYLERVKTWANKEHRQKDDAAIEANAKAAEKVAEKATAQETKAEATKAEGGDA